MVCLCIGIQTLTHMMSIFHIVRIQLLLYSFQRFVTNYTILSTIFAVFQPAITCSKLTIETLEQGVKYVQS